MTTSDYTLIPNLEELIDAMQPDSIVSRTFYKGGDFKAILFAFDAGQELSEHTSSKSAILHIVEGEGRITLGEDVHKVDQGAWIQMPPHLKHSVYAEIPLKVLLLLFESA